MSKNKASFCSLDTPFGGEGAGFFEYPRPQMKRDSYMSLCGEWELYSSLDGHLSHIGKINVPFVPESRLSGICRTKRKCEKYVYKRTFLIDAEFMKNRLLLHFGAADQIARVFINGSLAGEHLGGYLPFEIDITEFASVGENFIEVEITDELDKNLPYGKQRKKRGGMWYTPISGIWQAVWIESVPEDHVKGIKLTPSLDSITIEVEGGKDEKTVCIQRDSDEEIHTFSGNKITIKISNPKLWTPEDPYLYNFTLQSGKDVIESYFALRTVTIEARNGKQFICLNGEPYFFHGVLDQGYYPDGIYLPPSPKGYEWDILTMKELGFNMLRKHIKIEPDLFYYFCDKHGMIVFQDMVNSGRYDFILDTALPTIGIRNLPERRASKKRKAQFKSDCLETVRHLYNHPSVCCYTIFNEGWGQHDADGLYRLLKKTDPTKIWDAASGWFTKKESDVQSEHIYFRPVKLKRKTGRPLVLSEFGGYSMRVEGHCFNLSNNYGYKLFDSAKALTEGLEKLYLSEVCPEIEKNGLCCTVLTQLSDVEDETNGLCTYDRRVIKVDNTVMKTIAENIKTAFVKTTKTTND